ncbi:MAG: Verru_Chthon cassette protein B [Roseimicrobium sp.]
MKKNLLGRRPQGFSLPEVAIAVAIAALGIITLLGLLPSGLDNVRQAGNAVSISRIYQQMVSEMQSADWGQAPSNGTGLWSNLTKYEDARRYFDSEGTPLNRSGTHTLTDDEYLRLAYVARYEFVPIEGAIVPGAGSAPDGATRPDSQRVIIHVAISTSPSFDFEKELSRHEKRAFTITRQF